MSDISDSNHKKARWPLQRGSCTVWHMDDGCWLGTQLGPLTQELVFIFHGPFHELSSILTAWQLGSAEHPKRQEVKVLFSWGLDLIIGTITPIAFYQSNVHITHSYSRSRSKHRCCYFCTILLVKRLHSQSISKGMWHLDRISVWILMTCFITATNHSNFRAGIESRYVRL